VTTYGIDEDADVESGCSAPCDSCKDHGIDCKMCKNEGAGCKACNVLNVRCSHNAENTIQASEEQPAATQEAVVEATVEQTGIAEAPPIEDHSFDVEMMLDPRSEMTIGEETTQETTGTITQEPSSSRVTFAIPSMGSMINLASLSIAAIEVDLGLEDAMGSAFEGLGQMTVRANPE